MDQLHLIFSQMEQSGTAVFTSDGKGGVLCDGCAVPVTVAAGEGGDGFAIRFDPQAVTLYADTPRARAFAWNALRCVLEEGGVRAGLYRARPSFVSGASFGGGKADPGERAGPAAGAAGRVSDRGAALAGYGAGLLRAGPVRPGKPAKGRAGAGSSAAAVPLSDPQGRRDERRGRAAAVAAGGISAAVHKKARRSFQDLRAFVLAQREGFEPSCSCLQTDFES